MKRLEKIYEGKSKNIHTTEDPDLLIQYFKDDASAFNGIKKGEIVDKGIVNNHVSAAIFKFLEGKGIKTHMVKELNDREMLVKKLDIILVEVVLRNVVAGSLAKRMGRPEGETLKNPILEFYYKNDDLGDPMINEYHIREFGLATDDEIEMLCEKGLKINQLLWDYFKERKIRLVDFKLEFGRHKGEILLGDEISPDGCRLWHWDTNEKMDKDRFRFDLGQVKEKYEEVYHMICG
ncbi:Phosphoribosylaminoimidazole-succinocarboxamide synthase [Nitrospina gracilis 3/211]|uniref:Phosphoribosylaminoimidazole-succinocarboxamide synthase n=1 Tax=Nitrospina gracilis (strain 3/211) TaxID=1266370 RepID=M1Z2E8_NITG3|nr:MULTISPECIES: phosphoribosylaminoimidazolesuccinocarboxamide synthase [Nitrospina]MCF8722491.1 phosphoribosylaminoimidazole-succinocarboxamide synthase [Nitrospina sp. Nb-3]CCQ91921.1 Phosphoribosylaminoimidazole-succinocarboxamide synthase [Nitrospina gracilis 3/211]